MKMIFVSGLKEIDRKTIVNLALQRSGYKDKFKYVDFDDQGNLEEDMENTKDMLTAKKIMSDFYDSVERRVIRDLKEQIGNIIVNGYLSIHSPMFGYFLAVPETFFQTFKPDVIVILEMDSKDERIKEQQGINRYYAATYSSLCGSNLKIIRFSEDRMLDAVKELSDLIKH
jgi:adenylate kinase